MQTACTASPCPHHNKLNITEHPPAKSIASKEIQPVEPDLALHQGFLEPSPEHSPEPC